MPGASDLVHPRGVPGVPGSVARAVVPGPLTVPHDVVLTCNVLVVGEPERRSVTVDGAAHGFDVVPVAMLDHRGRPVLLAMAIERLVEAVEVGVGSIAPTLQSTRLQHVIFCGGPKSPARASIDAPQPRRCP